MVYRYHLHLDRRRICLSDQRDGSVFQKNSRVGDDSKYGSRKSSGVYRNSKKKTRNQKAIGDPQRSRSAVHKRRIQKQDRRNGKIVFEKRQSMGQRLHRKLSFTDQERMDQLLPFRNNERSEESRVRIYRRILQYDPDPFPLRIRIPDGIREKLQDIEKDAFRKKLRSGIDNGDP